MHFVYHMCPPELSGDTLYPLSTLQRLYPAIYEREMIKYQDYPGVRDLASRYIPELQCRWQDVVHCTSIHPYWLYTALCERGLAVRPGHTFFQIPLSALTDARTVIVRDYKLAENTSGEQQVSWLDPASYHELTQVPESTLRWYDRLAPLKKGVALFVGLPLVFVHGPIPLALAHVISWQEPPGTR